MTSARHIGRLRYWLHPRQAPRYGAGFSATDRALVGLGPVVRREPYADLTCTADLAVGRGHDARRLLALQVGDAPAVWAATERPDLITGLVLIGPFVRDHELSPVMRTALRVMSVGSWKVRA